VTEEAVVSSLCDFLSKAISLHLVEDFRAIMDWISTSIHAQPVTGHILLIRQCHSLLEMLEEYPPIVEFIANVNTLGDSLVAIEVYGLVAVLARAKWPIFFDVFSVEFFMALVTADDHRVVEIGLELLTLIILEPPLVQRLEEIVGTLIDGVFKGFGDSSIRIVVNILWKLVATETCPAGPILETVFSHVKDECVEKRVFRRTLTAPKNETTELTLVSAMKKMVRIARLAGDSPESDTA
jgi:hypothetical protein